MSSMSKWYAGLPTVLRKGGVRRRGLLRGWLRLLARRRSGKAAAARGTLQQAVASLSSRQKDMAFLGEAAQLFQACRSIEEICKVARDGLQGLSPGLSGALFLTAEADEYLENVMVWGAVEESDASFAPSDCWALRCGRPHQVSRGHDGIVCVHADAGSGDWHLCVPMVAQGEALGILYFRGDDSEGGGAVGTIAEDRLHLYLGVAETLSLAVANIRMRESLRYQAIRDPLTGLYNRRYFLETLSRELHRAARVKQPVSLAMLDVDHFKRFNDTYGHDAGDAALRIVGEILSSGTRVSDIACRHGGEEFVLAFPGLAADGAATRVEALRREIGARDIPFLGKSIDPVTFSAGLAVYPDDARDAETLLRAADQALYESKRTGRNRVTLASAQPTPSNPEAARPLTLVYSAEAEDGAPRALNALASSDKDAPEITARDASA